ncbi:MAG: PorP/SprF family type IX secretion system membrane protein, partial [Saprospiraceae bacterium]
MTIISLLLCATIGFSQDIHWSQFYNSPLNLNPALTGMFNGEARFAGNYRSQWNKVPVNYLTFSGAVDKKFTSKQLKGSQVGGGLILNYDRAGDSKLSATKLGVVGSYIRPLNKSNLISIGLQIGIAQRAFSDSNLRFDNQWDGDLVNTNLSTGENFDNRSFFFSDFTVGANWRTQNVTDKRTKIDLGVMLDHFVQPNQRFYENETTSKLFRKFMIYGDGAIKLANAVDFTLHGLGAWQGSYKEFVLGLGGKVYINKASQEERAIKVGVNFRVGDSFIPNIEY